MKRSDAIKLMQEASWRDHPAMEAISDEVADAVLYALEKAGMLPPQRNADLKSSYGYAQLWQWESE